MPKVFVSFGKMLTLMLVDKAESSIWKFNVNGIKKYLHSGFYFNFENTLLPDFKYFWNNHIRKCGNSWWSKVTLELYGQICSFLFVKLIYLVRKCYLQFRMNLFPSCFFHLLVFLPSFKTLVHWPLILKHFSNKMFIHHRIKPLLTSTERLDRSV